MINKIRSEIHNAVLNFRALERLIESVRFEQALNLDPNNIRVQFAIVSGNLDAVEEWVKETLRKEVGLLTLRELRIRAASLGIRYYTTLSKDQLITAITKAQNDRRIEKVTV